MKKTFIIPFVLIVLAGCGGDSGSAGEIKYLEKRLDDLQEDLDELKGKREKLDSRTAGGQAIDLHPSLVEKTYEIKGLITNMSGPIKTRYISVDIVCEGYAADFEKIMEVNDYRLRSAALQVLASYGYEESQQDGFIKRVEVDLRKRFDVVLQKHSVGDSQLISKLFFTEFVIQ
tara:strand:+ start:1150 stop:1671 length:522 start_codon:yes stop_codon:yes gene_type:complete